MSWMLRNETGWCPKRNAPEGPFRFRRGFRGLKPLQSLTFLSKRNETGGFGGATGKASRQARQHTFRPEKEPENNPRPGARPEKPVSKRGSESVFNGRAVGICRLPTRARPVPNRIVSPLASYPDPGLDPGSQGPGHPALTPRASVSVFVPWSRKVNPCRCLSENSLTGRFVLTAGRRSRPRSAATASQAARGRSAAR
jgi:hypothetical protein